MLLILSTSEGWKAESTLEPRSGFERETPGSGIQRLNHQAIDDQCSPHKETSQLVFSGNQLTGLSEMKTLVVSFKNIQEYEWFALRTFQFITICQEVDELKLLEFNFKRHLFSKTDIIQSGEFS